MTPAPSIPTAPLFIVLNAASGHSDTEETSRAIAGELDRAGRAHEILRVEDPEHLNKAAQDAVNQAREHDGIVIAAGGDGTLNTVAQAALGSGCQFGVIPQGTFNYFGRTHGISSDTAEATRALLTARVRPVQVGLVNDRVFLVNASVGLYPKLLEEREQQTQRHGRSRLVALWAALVSLWQGHRPMLITLEHEGKRREMHTLTLFVGNNRLQLEQVGLTEAAVVEDGKLVVVLVRPVPTLTLLWLALQGALGTLGRARGVDHFSLTRLTVSSSSRRVRRMQVAIDGETSWMRTPLEIRIAPQPLFLLTPVDTVPAAAAA